MMKQDMKVISRLLEMEGSFDTYMNSAAIATAVFDNEKRLLWQNPSFSVATGGHSLGRHMDRVFSAAEWQERKNRLILGGVSYTVDRTPLEYEGNNYLLVRLVDKATRTVDANRAYLPIVCLMEVDNKKELVRELSLEEAAELDYHINRTIGEFAGECSALYIKTSGSTYFLCMYYKELERIRDGRFVILDHIRKITTAKGDHPTISLAIGTGNTPALSYKYAQKALTMALGRGGDQAVIGNGTEFVYYGGVQRAIEVKTRVKTRSVARALHSLAEQCDEVLIMGHRMPDLDCVGSAMGLIACAKRVGKRARFVHEGRSVGVDEALLSMSKSGKVVSPASAALSMSDHTLLVIVDTQTESNIIAHELISRARNLVVIDHHVKTANSIEGATLYYSDPYASSVCEMVAEITQYFSDETDILGKQEAEALLAGMTMDTKGFKYNTRARTFDAAAFLKRSGADICDIHKEIADDLATYKQKIAVIKDVEVDGGVAIAYAAHTDGDPHLIGSKAADMLADMNDIDAAFVLIRTGASSVVMKARSLSAVNVENIAEELGGGGHSNMAAAVLKTKSKEEAIAMVKRAIDKNR